jgi:glutamate N-acetyltransferase/amino-acid N-acetyltransferase
MARAAAIALGCDADEIAIASTGVIGVPLPDHKIRASLPELVRELAADGWTAAATAICTTDRAPKIASRRIKVADADVTVGGIAKGAGMIAPSMATMLAFVATDAHADAPTLDQIVRSAASETFNRIIVDGDRSTNDTLIVVATGAASADASDPVVRGALTTAVTDVCRDLALKIVRDGEGARRIAEITVEGARNAADAEVLARAVGHSNLFKTALYGGDPNWGRIAAAVGSREIAVLEETLEIEIAGVPMFHRGKVADAAARARAAAAMQAPVVPVRVRIGRGPGAATVWASDLGHEYVTCNADYTT